MKKCLVDYAGDVSHMADVVRGTVCVCGSIDDLYLVLDKFVTSRRFQSEFAYFTRIKDRFQKPLGHYRDILCNIRVAGFVCELQFNLECLVKIKESGAGHGHYESE